MIRTIRGVEKECIFTLTENITLESPQYWFILTSQEDSQNTSGFTMTDMSPSIGRYNAFNVLPGTGTTSGSTFELESGTYDYSIYESTSGTSATIVGAPVETGLWLILDSSATSITKSGTTYDPNIEENTYYPK